MSDRLSTLNLDLVPASRSRRRAPSGRWLDGETHALVIAPRPGGERALDDFEGETSGRDRPGRPGLPEERGRAPAAPRVAAAAPARHAHLGRLRRSHRPGDAGPRRGDARASAGASRRSSRSSRSARWPARAASPPQVMDDATGRDVRPAGWTGRHRRRRRPPEDARRRRRDGRRRLHVLHHRPLATHVDAHADDYDERDAAREGSPPWPARSAGSTSYRGQSVMLRDRAPPIALDEAGVPAGRGQVRPGAEPCRVAGGPHPPTCTSRPAATTRSS